MEYVLMVFMYAGILSLQVWQICLFKKKIKIKNQIKSMQNKQQIAQELNYLFSDNEVEVAKILEKYNIAKFDAIAITQLVFDLSKQLSKMYISE